MQTHVTSRKLVRLGTSIAAIAAMSALTPSRAHASSTCSSLAIGAFRAVYNTTGNAVLAYEAYQAQYWACRAVEAL